MTCNRLHVFFVIVPVTIISTFVNNYFYYFYFGKLQIRRQSETNSLQSRRQRRREREAYQRTQRRDSKIAGIAETRGY